MDSSLLKCVLCVLSTQLSIVLFIVSFYLILVSCLCWNDGILVTASWDSTVKVSFISKLSLHVKNLNDPVLSLRQVMSLRSLINELEKNGNTVDLGRLRKVVARGLPVSDHRCKTPKLSESKPDNENLLLTTHKRP